MANRFDLAKKYTQQYKGILLPCQECKGTDIRIVSDRSIFKARNEWGVCCSHPCCDCTGTYSSVKEAVAAWNAMQKRRIAATMEGGVNE